MPPYHPPDFLDNSDTRQMGEALRRIILEWQESELDIATGYFEPHVWNYLKHAFPRLTGLRLMLGRPPEIAYQGQSAIDLRRYFRRKIQGELEELPYNAEYVTLIDELLAFLRREGVRVRLYGQQFLHAKAYLFPHVAIVGSSNLTPSGLTRNSELNLVQKSEMVAGALRREWFEPFWNRSDDYKDELLDILEKSKFGSSEYTPFDVFIKVLYEYFKDRLGEDSPEAHLGVDLASFQQEGLNEAIRLLEKHRGVLIADAVGLGKTYIGMGLLEQYLLRKRRRGYIPRGIVVCPAQLRDLVWQPKLDEYGIKATVLSMEEMGRSDFNWQAHNKVDFVLVDESHNFRNPGTGRHRNLMKLLATGNRDKRVVLMSATPINNSVWDLYHQVSLITRAEDSYYQDYGLRNLTGFFKAVARGEAELFDLLELVCVRRSRHDIRRRQQAGEVITLPGHGEIRFPRRELEAVHYDLTSTYSGFYAEVEAAIEALTLVPYNIEQYRKQKDEESEQVTQRNHALIGIMKVNLLKRLESSIAAFEISIRRAAAFQQRFFGMLAEEGRLLDSPHYRKILAMEAEGEEEEIEALIAELPEVNIAEYDLAAISDALQADLALFRGMLKRLDKIRLAGQEIQDGKLAVVKARLAELLAAGEKVLVFSYYRDTANYLFDSLQTDESWQEAAGQPVFELITGSTDPGQRTGLVQRFAPKANLPELPSAEKAPLPGPEINLLISTDVLSEGQNLQDAATLINYDLHWNPVRMIQRAGRIDRLGSDYEALLIVNVFPEEGLEELLRLVERLQKRIMDIDRTVGLDASVLGEVVTPRSLEELRRLKAGDRTVLDELEQEAELTSTDEMKLPLVTALQSMGAEKVKSIPLGIHSGKSAPARGTFFAFRARDQHFWRFYPDDGRDPITDKRQIFRWIEAGPETPRRAVDSGTIFELLERATGDIFREISAARASRRLRPKMAKLNRDLHAALNQSTLEEGIVEEDPTFTETVSRVIQAVEEVNLKPFRYDPVLKEIRRQFEVSGDRRALVTALDTWFVENELYRDVARPSTLEQIKREDLALICWERLG